MVNKHLVAGIQNLHFIAITSKLNWFTVYWNLNPIFYIISPGCIPNTCRVDPGSFVQMGIFVHVYLVLCCQGKNNVIPNMKTQSFSWKPILLENPFPQHQTLMSCLQ